MSRSDPQEDPLLDLHLMAAVLGQVRRGDRLSWGLLGLSGLWAVLAYVHLMPVHVFSAILWSASLVAGALQGYCAARVRLEIETLSAPTDHSYLQVAAALGARLCEWGCMPASGSARAWSQRWRRMLHRWRDQCIWLCLQAGLLLTAYLQACLVIAG